MKNKKYLIGLLLLMAIGFAAVSTTLYLNGTVNIESNLEDYDVYYSNAKVNGEEDKSVIVDDTHIIFENEFNKVGETYTVEYDITNGSKNYDADVVMSCTAENDYIRVTNSWVDHTVINSTETKSGTLKAEVIKSYTGDDELELNVSCEITAAAQERTTQGTGTTADRIIPTVYGISGMLVDGDNNPITSGVTALFSEPKYMELSSDGRIDFIDVPAGKHTLCLVKNKTLNEVKAMSEDEVKANAESCIDFSTQSKTIKNNKMSLTELQIGSVKEIALNANGGELSSESITINTSSTYGSLPTPTRSGYQFLGWYNESDEEITSTTRYEDKQANTLTAKWIINKYQITLEGNKVNINTTNVEIEYGKNGKVTATPIEGHYLSEVKCSNGYTTNAQVGESKTTSQEVTIENNNNDTTSKCTFVASPKEYTVTLSVSNGTASSSTIKINYGSSKTVTITPNNKYYIESVSCTNGYTTNAVVGKTSTSAKTITINNNNNDSNSTCTVTTEQLPAFEADSWEIIAANVKAGNISQYQVGDTKPVDMGTLGTHTVRVANTTECTNGETSKAACGFVVEFADIITTHNMNSANTNVGGWRDSAMRTYVNNDIYSALPSDLQSVISDTTVVSGYGSTSGETNFITTDKLYLLNAEEVWGETPYDASVGTSRQLDYYKNMGVRYYYAGNVAKMYKKSFSDWWLRSAYSDDTSNFLYVNSGGSRWASGARLAYGVSPAFRIA